MRDHAKAVTLLSSFSQHPGTPVSPRQLTTMVGKLCDFSKVTFPNACHRAFCYCTSCHFTFPSQTYIQKSFFYRKCSDNDQIYVLWNFGLYKDYMPKP